MWTVLAQVHLIVDPTGQQTHPVVISPDTKCVLKIYLTVGRIHIYFLICGVKTLLVEGVK